jgi:hypothetical protein
MLVDQKKLMLAYASGAYADGVKLIVSFLVQCRSASATELTPQLRAQIDLSVEAIVFYLTRMEFSLNRKEYLTVLSTHSIFTHLLGLSSYDNTENVVRTFFRNSVVTLPSMLMHINRNQTPPPRKKFFELDSILASEWYGQYFSATRTFINPVVRNNLREHLNYWHKNIAAITTVSNGFMRSTYIDPYIDRNWRYRFNSLIKIALAKTRIQNKPNKRKIALITGRWAKTHPTHKNRVPIVQELAKSYDLTLVHCGPKRDDLDTSSFVDVRHVDMTGGKMDISDIQKNDWGLVYYPDIGMNVESRFLSNLRIAPAQVMSNSHPVSTFGGEIDYFLTGSDSEAVSSPELNYTERLVLVPGIGTIPERSAFGNTGPRPAFRQPKNIACPWGSLKINDELIGRMKNIREKLNCQPRFVFFVSIDSSALSVPLLRKELELGLGTRDFDLYANAPYELYIEKLQQCIFALDAFPFGGNTSVIDCIVTATPIICQAGWQFYNLAGPVMLKRAGVEGLVASDRADYIDMAVKLFSEPSLRSEFGEKLIKLDVDEFLASLSSLSSFIKAFDFMMRDGGKKGVSTPVRF